MNVSRYRCSVLAVDDDAAIRELLVNQLAQDFDLFPAATVDEARTILAQRTVDILITDLSLPGEDGISFLEWVRRTMPRTARVLLTAPSRLAEKVDAFNQSQVHRLVLKPWRPEDLLQTLRTTARNLLLERSHEQLLDELRQLNIELEKRVAARTEELHSALHQLQQKNLILEKMALTDPLTGLPNRRAIDLIARKELLRRSRTPAPIGFALIDADHFKMINEVHLLSGGDHALIWLASRLLNSIRGTDSIGRVGGEEFMLVAPGTDAEGASILAERIRSNVESSSTIYAGRPIRMTVSIGFATVAADVPIGYEQLRETAATALKQAKDQGRNRVVLRDIKEPTSNANISLAHSH